MIHIPFFPRSRTDTGDWTKEMVEKEKKGNRFLVGGVSHEHLRLGTGLH